jgi:hypothetical protein
VNSNLNGFNGGNLLARNCDFTGCTIFGLRAATLMMADCSFDSSALKGNWYELPSDLVFRNCFIKTKDDEPFLRLGGYTVGKIGFDGCTVSGRLNLVDVTDLRAIPYPADADPSANPDRKPGVIAFRSTKWKSAAETVLTHVKSANPSAKKITILDKNNQWPKGVNVMVDVPDRWEVKK